MVERPFHEITVDELARSAGISRPTFYFYFPSKNALLIRLMHAMVTEAGRETVDAVDEVPHRDVKYLAHTVIADLADMLTRNRGVVLAAVAARSDNEIARMWSTFMSGWVQRTAGMIKAARRHGAIPATVPVDDLATTLTLLAERAITAEIAIENPAPRPETVVDTLAHIWWSSICCTTPRC